MNAAANSKVFGAKAGADIKAAAMGLQWMTLTQDKITSVQYHFIEEIPKLYQLLVSRVKYFVRALYLLHQGEDKLLHVVESNTHR